MRRQSVAWKWIFCVLFYFGLLSSAVAQPSEREDTDNVCVIHLIGVPGSQTGHRGAGALHRVSFECTGTNLPVPIRVHPSVLEAATLQEGVLLSADHEVRGLIQFEDVLSLTVLDSVFEELVGGGLAPVVFDKSAGLFYNCSFVKNSFARTGGIYAAGGSLMHVYDSLFLENSGDSYGAVSTTSGCNTLFRNTKFLHNKGGAQHNEANGFVSGAVFSFQSTLTEFEGCELKNNVAEGAGAGAFTGLKRAIVKFSDCTIDGNYGQSGAISLTDLSTGTLNNTLFMKNSGTDGGSPIHLNLRSDLIVVVSHFTQNEGDSGVIIAHHSSGIDIEESTFVSNNGAAYGGAVSTVTGGFVVIERCKFEANSGVFGGAVYQDRLIEAVFKDSRFVGNTAVFSGGAIFQKDVNITLIGNCEFADNDGGAVGGALSQTGCGEADWLSPSLQHKVACAEGGEPTCEKIEVTESVFEGNTAERRGSSMFNDRCKDVVVISTSFPDKELSIVQERCITRRFESNTANAQLSVFLNRCPADASPDRKLLLTN